jgi:hypothetical protein
VETVGAGRGLVVAASPRRRSTLPGGATVTEYRAPEVSASPPPPIAAAAPVNRPLFARGAAAVAVPTATVAPPSTSPAPRSAPPPASPAPPRVQRTSRSPDDDDGGDDCIVFLDDDAEPVPTAACAAPATFTDAGVGDYDASEPLGPSNVPATLTRPVAERVPPAGVALRFHSDRLGAAQFPPAAADDADGDAEPSLHWQRPRSASSPTATVGSHGAFSERAFHHAIARHALGRHSSSSSSSRDGRSQGRAAGSPHPRPAFELHCLSLSVGGNAAAPSDPDDDDGDGDARVTYAFGGARL